jgi:hypothetical protein
MVSREVPRYRVRRGALFCLAFCWPAALRAEAPRKEGYSLNWVRESGAEGCVSSSGLAQLLEQMVGPVLTRPDQAGILIEGIASPRATGTGYRALIRVQDSNGEFVGQREIENGDPRCTALTSSVLLVVAILIDPDSAARGLPPSVLDELSRSAAEEKVVERPLPPPAPVEPQPRERGQAPAKREQSPAVPPLTKTFQWRADAALGTEILPEPSVGLSASVEALTSPVTSLSAELVLWLPQSRDFAGPRAREGGIDWSAVQASLLWCRSLPFATRFSAEACGGGVLGFRIVDAEALAGDNSVARPFFGPTLGLGARWRPSESWFLRASASALWSARSDRFVYTTHEGQVGEMFEPSPFSGFLALGVGSWL